MALGTPHGVESTSETPTPSLPLPRIYAWFSAVTDDDMDLMEDLLIHGIPVDVPHPLRHTTALMEATRQGRMAMVKWLLDRHAAPALLCGMPKGSALHCALRRKHWNIATLLIDHTESTAIVDAYGCTPLHALCIEPQEREDTYIVAEIAAKLLDKKCPIDALDHEGTTALHHCVLNNAIQLSNTLLIRGANPNALIPDSWVSPLTIAALEKNLQMARVLLRYRANPHQQTRDGFTPASIYPLILGTQDD